MAKFIALAAFQPDPDAKLDSPPHLGCTMTGWKGSPERDRYWHQAVRQVKGSTDAPRFEFKARPKETWESLETIHLGGGSMGFVGSREGRQQLLDNQGRPLPLLAHPLPLKHGACQPPVPRGKYLIADADARTVNVCSVEPEGRLLLKSSTPGQIDVVLERGAFILVRQAKDDGSFQHRLYRPDGTEATDETYEAFREQGCGFVEVLSRGQWLSLLPDGTTTARRFVPFSC